MNKLINLKSLLIVTLFGITISSKAQNPIEKDAGMADPHIHIFNNKAYLYTTRDGDKTAKSFVMPDWKIWSSDDLVHWKLERTIEPTETYMGKSNNCWAADVAFKNGFYYYYFSNENVNTGVMKSKFPAGPYIDALGKPLLPETLTVGKEYDPTVILADDKEKTPYIVFGHYSSDTPNLSYFIAKLNDNMVSLAEAPRKISIIGDKNVLKANDKPNLHKRNGIYYLSAGTHYATSTNIYGPYTRRGDTGNGNFGLNSRAHGNFFEWKNQWFHTWCHFHLGKEVARYRESYISYLHYKDNGEMVTDVDFLEQHFATGVGQYDATWNKIEAEWYMAATNVEKRESKNGGFEIQKIKNNGSLYFPNVKNMAKANAILFQISSQNAGGTIEVYSNDKNGKCIGIVKVENTGGWDKYKTIKCALEDTADVQNIYFKFKGTAADLFHLDSFQFQLK